MNVTGSSRQLIIVGILAAAVMYFGPVKWALGQTDSVKQDVQATRDATGAIENRVGEAKKAKSNEAQYQAELERFRAALPAAPNQADLIDLISDTAADAGVVWKSNAASDPAAPAAGSSASSGASSNNKGSSAATAAGLATITQSVEVNGSQEQIAAFVTALREAPRVLAVDNVTISQQAGDAAASARMTVRAFTWKAGAAK